jgi:hypothetical protein
VKLGPKEEPAADALGMPEDEGGGLFDEYADDAMAALKSGDKAAFRAALKSAVMACKDSGLDDEV